MAQDSVSDLADLPRTERGGRVVLDVTHFSVPLAHQVWRLTRIEPPLGPVAAWPTPADLKRAGRTRTGARLKKHGCRRHATWAGQIVSALEHQTVVVAGTNAAATVLPHPARQPIAPRAQRTDVATQAGGPGGWPTLMCQS